jgi:phosphoglucosamine mutase
MAKHYFGTDGIRGRTNSGVMTADVAMRVGQAAGRRFLRGAHRHRVVIGKDTRLSGYMLENAMVAGFTSVGMDVVLLGPMPTPAVAMLTRELRADVGVMISASHNPYEDNGIKLFGPDGFKLSDEDEIAIEAMLGEDQALAPAEDIGRARRIEDARGRYIHAVKASLPDDVRLDGLKIVVDCANGAAYQVAPSALWELGAEIHSIGVNPNGRNINDKVGSTHLDAVKETVVASGADIGIALDGDADRLIVVDEKGQTVDGDQIMALIGSQWAEQGRLAGGGVVATVMSNLGLERFLGGKGVALIRTKVGDRYVLEAMKAGGYSLGGEQSGHVIMSDYATTGDGVLTALHLLERMAVTGQSLASLASAMTRLPQVLVNVQGVDKDRCDTDEVLLSAVEEAAAALGDEGRILLRASGTEPLVRVMVEATSQIEAHAVADKLADVVRERLAL